MTPLFSKLNLKGQQEIAVLNAPESFEPELAALGEVAVRRSLADIESPHFVLAFVTRQREVDSLAVEVAAQTKGDALVWLAYPKGSSKRYRCEFNRDTGWQALGSAGFEPVRQVAIDEDWSALRFRRVEYIKTLTRSPRMALSAAGQERVAQNKETPTHDSHPG